MRQKKCEVKKLWKLGSEDGKQHIKTKREREKSRPNLKFINVTHDIKKKGFMISFSEK